MKREEFEKMVAEGYDQLPEWVRQKINNVALLVEDEPSKEDREAEGLSDGETLLGLYKGIPLSARGEFYGVGMTMPDTITLYRLPILQAAEENLDFVNPDDPYLDLRNPDFAEAVKKVVAETIWHEFAHHFGMDEYEVRDREHKRDFPNED
jgi:predicted Zn-dependent protease with MMP-like domain